MSDTRGCAAAIALAVATSTGGCNDDPPKPSYVRFQETKPPKTNLEHRGAVPLQGLPWAWGPDELSPALVQKPLRLNGSDQVEAFHLSPSDRLEALVFARDPTVTKVEIVNAAVQERLTGQEAPWLAQVGSLDALPRAVAFRANAYPDGDAALVLAPGHFFGAAAVASKANVDRSVRALYVVDHGLCSAAQPLDGILAQVHERLWNEFVAGLPNGGACSSDLEAFLEYAHVQSYMEHARGALHDLRGGFLLDVHLTGDIYNVFADDVSAYFTVQYEWALDDGILSVKPTFHQTAVTGHDAENVEAGAKERLSKDLPRAIRKIALEEQTNDVLPFRVSCKPAKLAQGEGGVLVLVDDEKDQCKEAADALGGLVDFGQETVNELHGHDLTDAERNALMDATNAVVPGSNPPRYRHWACVRDEPDDPDKGHCELVVRAKRVIPLPDEVELVWFDGKELDNPAYALWVAAHAAGQEQVDRLCVSKLGDEARTRAFTRAHADPAWSVSQCPIQEVTGGGGCATSGRRGPRDGWLAALGALGMLAAARRRTVRRPRG